MKIQFALGVLTIFTGLLASTSAAKAQTNTPAHRFEPTVRHYEAMDISNAPPTNAILLAGDSQFRAV